jgi:uncharacterized SAM-binding protein YcdF (DUF218 family)
MSLAWLVRIFGRPLERRDHFTTVDAIVVVGSPLAADGSLSDVLEERVATGVALWKRGVAPRLLLAGGRAPGQRSLLAEAEAMAERAFVLGVPRSAIVVERESRNTSMNAKNIAVLCSGLAIRTVIVVSQPFHLRRAVLWFRRMGLDAVGHAASDSVQFRQPSRGLRWVGREYVSLARDLWITRRPGG